MNLGECLHPVISVLANSNMSPQKGPHQFATCWFHASSITLCPIQCLMQSFLDFGCRKGEGIVMLLPRDVDRDSLAVESSIASTSRQLEEQACLMLSTPRIPPPYLGYRTDIGQRILRAGNSHMPIGFPARGK